MIATLAAFVGVGGAAALAYVVVASLFVAAGFTPWLVSVLCYAAFVPVVYLTQKRLAFRSSAPHAAAFPRYAATQMLGVALAAALPYATAAAVPPAAGFLAVAVLVAAANFVLLRWWAFR